MPDVDDHPQENPDSLASEPTLHMMQSIWPSRAGEGTVPLDGTRDNPDSPVLSDGERSELEALRRWKRQATIVLDQWEDVWVSAGRPGRLGFSKPAAVQDEIARLRERARHV